MPGGKPNVVSTRPALSVSFDFELLRNSGSSRPEVIPFETIFGAVVNSSIFHRYRPGSACGRFGEPSSRAGGPTQQAAAVPAAATAAVTTEVALTAWLEHYQPTTSWVAHYRALEAAQTAALAKINTAVTPQAKKRTYLFTASGNGSGNTSPFTIRSTTTQWHLAWSYNCASFGSSGDFSVDINGGPRNGPTDQDYNDNGPDTQGMGGTGVDTYYDTGTFNFQVWANCNWTLRVTK